MPASTGFGGFKPPRFPPKEDKRVPEPDLPPRPPKSNNVVKGPTVSVLLHYIISYDIMVIIVWWWKTEHLYTQQCQTTSSKA